MFGFKKRIKEIENELKTIKSDIIQLNQRTCKHIWNYFENDYSWLGGAAYSRHCTLCKLSQSLSTKEYTEGLKESDILKAEKILLPYNLTVTRSKIKKVK